MFRRLVSNSILHNSRQQTVTNDNKREQVYPANISSMYNIVPYIRSNYMDAKCSSVHSIVPAKEKPKNL